jgi:Uma2 family endonuclease
MSRTVILGEHPGVQRVIEERQALGLDGYDEVWGGEYHMAPMAGSSHGRVQVEMLALLRDLARAQGRYACGPFNLGLDKADFRVPDGGVLDLPVSEVWVPTALVVLEVLSPDDETFDKFPFYCRRGVREVIVADPGTRTVKIYKPLLELAQSWKVLSKSLLGITAQDITDAIDWP